MSERCMDPLYELPLTGLVLRTLIASRQSGSVKIRASGIPEGRPNGTQQRNDPTVEDPAAPQHGEGPDDPELASDLSVTTRTIRRDLQALQLAGFPIYDDSAEGAKTWRVNTRAMGALGRTGLTLSELAALYFSRALIECFEKRRQERVRQARGCPVAGHAEVPRQNAARHLRETRTCDPSRFVVLKLGASKRIAARMGADILYSSQIGWHTYSAMLDVSKELLERLSPLGARDYIDVQSFMWVTRDLE